MFGRSVCHALALFSDGGSPLIIIPHSSADSESLFLHDTLYDKVKKLGP